MSFSVGFQENHTLKLKAYREKILSLRANRIGGTVCLDTLDGAISKAMLLTPSRLLKLIELAKMEIDGTFEGMTKVCQKCKGSGERVQMFEEILGDSTTAYDFWDDCPGCGGTGKDLSTSCLKYFGLIDKRQTLRAKRECNLTFYGIYRRLHPRAPRPWERSKSLRASCESPVPF